MSKIKESILKYGPEEKKVTELQQKTIDKVIVKNEGCEVLLYESGIAGVIANYFPKDIVPQGDSDKAFNPSWTKKTYLIDKSGYILGIAVGEVR